MKKTWAELFKINGFKVNKAFRLACLFLLLSVIAFALWQGSIVAGICFGMFLTMLFYLEAALLRIAFSMTNGAAIVNTRKQEIKK